jgi:hypothetical protein
MLATREAAAAASRTCPAGAAVAESPGTLMRIRRVG